MISLLKMFSRRKMQAPIRVHEPRYLVRDLLQSNGHYCAVGWLLNAAGLPVSPAGIAQLRERTGLSSAKIEALISDNDTADSPAGRIEALRRFCKKNGRHFFWIPRY